MKTSSVNNVAFTSRADVLTSLEFAIDASRSAAMHSFSPTMKINPKLSNGMIGKNIGEVNNNLLRAISDRSFKAFINNFESFIDNPKVYMDKRTLKTFVNENFPSNDLRVRAKAFNIFRKEFIHRVKASGKDISMERVAKFLNVIQSQFTPADGKLSKIEINQFKRIVDYGA